MRQAKLELTVEGPEELKQTLSELSDPCYIHYKYGKQESLIKISPSFHIYHYNLLGRPATEIVKSIINDFINQHHSCFYDISREDMIERNQTGFLAASADKSRVVLSDEPITLAYAYKRLDQ